jgi:hypothetical protein
MERSEGFLLTNQLRDDGLAPLATMTISDRPAERATRSRTAVLICRYRTSGHGRTDHSTAGSRLAIPLGSTGRPMISVADGSSDATRKAPFGSVELRQAALALPVATSKAAGQIRSALVSEPLVAENRLRRGWDGSRFGILLGIWRCPSGPGWAPVSTMSPSGSWRRWRSCSPLGWWSARYSPIPAPTRLPRPPIGQRLPLVLQPHLP